MATRKNPQRKPRAARKPAAPQSGIARIRASALGAMSALAAHGAALQARGRRIALATARDARDAVAAGAGEARVRTVDAVSQLERVFEHRVARTMSRLGVPTARDVRALSRQVAQLQQSVDQLRRARARA